MASSISPISAASSRTFPHPTRRSTAGARVGQLQQAVGVPACAADAGHDASVDDSSRIDSLARAFEEEKAGPLLRLPTI
jgi:hypothetical protein